MRELFEWISNNIIEILKIIIPSLTSIFLVYLALVKDKFTSKRVVYKERVENDLAPRNCTSMIDSPKI